MNVTQQRKTINDFIDIYYGQQQIFTSKHWPWFSGNWPIITAHSVCCIPPWSQNGWCFLPILCRWIVNTSVLSSCNNISSTIHGRNLCLWTGSTPLRRPLLPRQIHVRSIRYYKRKTSTTNNRGIQTKSQCSKKYKYPWFTIYQFNLIFF